MIKKKPMLPTPNNPQPPTPCLMSLSTASCIVTSGVHHDSSLISNRASIIASYLAITRVTVLSGTRRPSLPKKATCLALSRNWE